MHQTYSSNSIDITNNPNGYPVREPDSGEYDPEGFINCPFCMGTEDLCITWERSLTQQPPFEYVFDVVLLCNGCGASMDEMGLDMAAAISSLQDRWNKRPKREDFSTELFKARMYDKQEKWVREQIQHWGPFTAEEMELYFGKSVFEMIILLRSIAEQTGHRGDSGSEGVSVRVMKDSIEAYRNSVEVMNSNSLERFNAAVRGIEEGMNLAVRNMARGVSASVNVGMYNFLSREEQDKLSRAVRENKDRISREKLEQAISDGTIKLIDSGDNQ